MPVKLNWYNNTQDLEQQNIYRNDSPIDEVNPGVPLATVGSGVFTYTDNTAVQGKFYYYAVGGVKDGDVSLSKQMPVLYVSDTGPGPTKIIRGDWEYGYFGTLPLADLADSATIRNELGLSGLGNPAGAAMATLWHKFAYKGKVIFFPDRYLFSNSGWKMMYDAGCMYGSMPVPDHVITRYGNVPQNKVITLNNRNYVFRQATSRAPGAADSVKTGGEVDELFAAVRLHKNYFAPGKFGVDDLTPMQASTYFLTTDMDAPTNPNSNVITRGATGTAPDNTKQDMVMTPVNPATITTAYNLKPILELVL
uniref:Virion structural protein n=1 Tax=Pseudomonas phage RVTF4 TaxID=3236931 RepID=A0AB39CD42_9VIRU